jgi:putative zinc finger protein
VTGATPHLGELRLRRFRLGELPATEREEIERHADGCGSCRARLRALDDEQRQFERRIPFERFAAGVERAQRVPRAGAVSRWRRPTLVAALGLAAAAAAGLIGVVPRAPSNRIKGATDAEAVLRVSGSGGEQHAVAPGGRLALRAGERVRLGVRSDAAGYLCAVSIDDAGVVTPLYPEHGAALPAPDGPAVSYLPDSLEFTGRGRERVFLVLGTHRFTVEEVAEAARAAYHRAHGDLDALGSLGTDATFTWLLRKP